MNTKQIQTVYWALVAILLAVWLYAGWHFYFAPCSDFKHLPWSVGNAPGRCIQ